MFLIFEKCKHDEFKGEDRNKMLIKSQINTMLHAGSISIGLLCGVGLYFLKKK